MSIVGGIHHITAISSDAQKTYDFYTKVLGLRFVKKTVNFDSPDTYHLYFGNEAGEPGTIITFFPFKDAGRGMRGTGQATKIQFAVPLGSLSMWLDRLLQHKVEHETITKQFGNSTLRFFDPDGLQLELVMTDIKDYPEPRVPVSGSEGQKKAATTLISSKMAISAFFGIELTVKDKEKTAKVLSEILDYTEVKTEGYHSRYQSKQANFAQFIDIFEMPGWPQGRIKAGTVHHVAFRADSKETQRNLRDVISEIDLLPTEVIDRQYFRSVYFREPNGILFEIATDPPGFTVDEDLAELGKQLKLPPQYETRREDISKLLPKLDAGRSDENIKVAKPPAQFVHKFIPGKNDEHTFLLLHGTGGDETDLIPLTQQINANFSILSLRGNIEQQGMNRFFRRNSDGSFDENSMSAETEKLQQFIVEAANYYKIETGNIVFLGYSNGANMGVNLQMRFPGKLRYYLLLHPMLVYQPEQLEESNQQVNVFISSGENDEYLRSEDEIANLQSELTKTGADVEVFTHKGGHQLLPTEIAAAKMFLLENLE
jgi:predicted esterase/catechol 2,3-dioxygenase-like lactoylglutathione lyase family enzyme